MFAITLFRRKTMFRDIVLSTETMFPNIAGIIHYLAQLCKSRNKRDRLGEITVRLTGRAAFLSARHGEPPSWRREQKNWWGEASRRAALSFSMVHRGLFSWRSHFQAGTTFMPEPSSASSSHVTIVQSSTYRFRRANSSADVSRATVARSYIVHATCTRRRFLVTMSTTWKSTSVPSGLGAS